MVPCAARFGRVEPERRVDVGRASVACLLVSSGDAGLGGFQREAIVEIDDRSTAHRRRNARRVVTADVAKDVAVDFEDDQGWDDQGVGIFDGPRPRTWETP